jgi:hypothetical protein
MKTLRKFSWLLVVALSLTLAVGVAYALFSDSGTVDVQVADYTHSVVDKTTDGGAYVSYFGDHDTTFGSSGTGVFDPFVRLQADGTESGYNTNGTVEFDTKTGKWTHAILVSHIPQRPCGPGGALSCFELWNDINENNKTPYISLNKVEVYFTDKPDLTGYPFSGSATTTAQYKFAGDVLINDVNQGSGRGDLRYDIPINGPNPITLPANCDYGNPACSTYFVLYSQWGTSTQAAPIDSYSSDGGFEEWKVKVYPAITLTKTPSTTDVCNGSNTSVTYTYVVTNNSPGGQTVDGTVVDDNGTPGDATDDVPIGTFSRLAAGASQTFTQVLTVNGTRTNTATATATDSKGQTATATATATVTGHVCTISLTKTPSQTNVCNGSSVTYTYVVTNNSDYFTWTGSLTDDTISLPAGAASFSLSPGESKTFTASANINGTVTNTATASGAFNDPASTSASATKSATVTGVNCAQITPTNTTCSDFASGTAATLSQIQYSLKNGTINQTSPGVFFYWVSVSGPGPFTINQTNTGGLPYFTLAPGAFAFDSNCNSITSATITQDGSGNVTITGSGIAYIGVKYSTSSVVGQPDPGTVTYTFVLASDPTSSQSIDLAPK